MEATEAELRGHQRITCRRCGYVGWSEDTGACPRCVAREEDHRHFDTEPQEREAAEEDEELCPSS